MKRLVFTIVAGFVGGSRGVDDVIQLDDGQRSPARHDAAEPSDPSPGDAAAGADPIGEAVQRRGLA
jgi:hypothetical protein